MPGVDQQNFLAGIRDAASARDQSLPLPEDHEIARVVPEGADLAEVFAVKASEAGMHVHRVAGDVAMIQAVVEVVDQARAQAVIVPANSIPSRETLIEALEVKGVQLMDPDDPDAAFTADIGITTVAAAIAETGSLCVRSGGEQRRLASLAVTTHIAIVRADQIVPDLIDWAAAHSGELPANEALISGPSKTADIELTLVTGVHGPGHVHVVLLP